MTGKTSHSLGIELFHLDIDACWNPEVMKKIFKTYLVISIREKNMYDIYVLMEM